MEDTAVSVRSHETEGVQETVDIVTTIEEESHETEGGEETVDIVTTIGEESQPNESKSIEDNEPSEKISPVSNPVSAEDASLSVDNRNTKVVFSADILQHIDTAKGWLILNHWATWCEPCIEEMPQLRELRRQLPENAELYGVSWDLFQNGDAAETVDRINKSTQEKDIPFSTWLVADSPEEFFSDLDISWQKIPQTWVIMPGGIRAIVIEGVLQDKDVTQILQLISH